MKNLLIAFGLFFWIPLLGQQPIYDVTSGHGNGIRFWASDSYKIHMGNGTEYQFGPVTDYSIKNNMNNNSGRGWTWGVNGATPIAALNTHGNMKVKGYFESGLKLVAPLFETQKTYNTKFQLATHGWSGAHGMLFNAYFDYSGTGNIMTHGNTYYANNKGNYNNGAGAIMFYGHGGSIDFLISPSSTGEDQAIAWGTPKMRINRSGDVGIGTTTPTNKLEVNGTIRSKEVKVEASPWPDYVFAPDYRLRSLKEIESFINENHHLPEMPSAEEVKENGIELGEINALLLKKIEELTLYVIEQEKKLKKQDKLEKQLVSYRLNQTEMVAIITSLQKEVEELKSIKSNESE